MVNGSSSIVPMTNAGPPLAPRANPAETEEAVADAAFYRSLGLPVLDSTDLEPRDVAKAIAKMIDPGFSRAAPTHFQSWA
jgi:hypothetical protein